MNQRQKVIAVIIAVPVIGMIAYAATRDGTRPSPASPMAPAMTSTAAPTENPGEPLVTVGGDTPEEAASAKVVGSLAKGGGHGNKKTLEEQKDEARKRLAAVDALTEDDYTKLRASRDNLPETLAEYKEQQKEKESQILNLTEEVYTARGGRGGKGGHKGGADHAKKGTDRAEHQKGEGKKNNLRHGGRKNGRAGAQGGAAKGGAAGDDTDEEI